MRVTCATCGEPWETDHLLFEAAGDIGDRYGGETAASQIAEMEGGLQTALREGTKLCPPHMIREGMEKLGWQFGVGAMSVHRCPCCPSETPTHRGRSAAHDAIADLLGDDIDGAASMLEELGEMEGVEFGDDD